MSFYVYDILFWNGMEFHIKGICKLKKEEYKQWIEDLDNELFYYDINNYDLKSESYTFKKLKVKPCKEIMDVLYKDLDEVICIQGNDEDENYDISDSEDEHILED